MGLPLFHPIVSATIDGLHSIPSLSPSIYCCIGDYRFGNYAYQDPSSAVCRTLNVSRSQCTAEVDGIMTAHTVKALKYLTAADNGTKFLPWDVTVRTSLFGKDYGRVKGTPSDLCDVSSSVVNLGDKIITPSMVSDRGCHPTLEGLQFLLATISPTLPPPPSFLRLILSRRNVVRTLLVLFHRSFITVILPLQRYLAVVRPRRRQRGRNLRLGMAYWCTTFYQFELWAITNVSMMNELGGNYFRLKPSIPYHPSSTLFFGWDEFASLSPPLLQ